MTLPKWKWQRSKTISQIWRMQRCTVSSCAKTDGKCSLWDSEVLTNKKTKHKQDSVNRSAKQFFESLCTEIKCWQFKSKMVQKCCSVSIDSSKLPHIHKEHRNWCVKWNSTKLAACYSQWIEIYIVKINTILQCWSSAQENTQPLTYLRYQ